MYWRQTQDVAQIGLGQRNGEATLGGLPYRLEPQVKLADQVGQTAGAVRAVLG